MALALPALLSATASSTITYTAPIPAPIVQTLDQTTDMSTSTVRALIEASAAKYGVNAVQLRNTLWCESQYKIGQSEYPDASGPNGREDSWGVAQIHLPDHPDVSREQAQDITFAVDWAAKEFAAGRATQWTCYRLLMSGKI